MFIDEERILVRAVGRAPVLDDAQAPGQPAGPVALGGNDGGQSFLLKPAEQAPDFGAQDTVVWQLAEERFNGVHNEETIEVVLASFLKVSFRNRRLRLSQSGTAAGHPPKPPHAWGCPRKQSEAEGGSPSTIL